MVWGAIAGAAIGALGSAYAGRQGAKAAERAADASAAVQREGLEYLKESERLPMYYRDQALGLLAGEYGLSPYQADDPGEGRRINPEYMEALASGVGSSIGSGFGMGPSAALSGIPMYVEDDTPPAPRRSVTDIAMASPLYSAIMSGREAGEEALARSAAATGGLRGGATIDDLARYNTELENQALLSSYQNVMGGLSSLAGQQGYAPQIAQQYSNIGQTLGAGKLAAGQAMQDAYGGIASSLGRGAEAYFNRPREDV